MKYVVVDIRESAIFTEEFDNSEEAMKCAERDWHHKTRDEKKRCIEYFVLESADSDPESPEHLDGNIIYEWKENGLFVHE